MTGKIRIMIVEDEFLVADDLQEMLQQLGYEVTGIVDSGEEAVPSALASVPDLILMDINLAGEMDGITAAEQIKARQDIPVLFLTAFATDVMVARAKLISPSGYILKPYSETQIRTSIEIARYNHSLEVKLKERERELAELNRDLERRVLDRTREVESLLHHKDLLIDMIGHDLKTPLTPLHALLPVLLSHEQDPKFRSFISICIEEIACIKGIIENVLTLAALNRGSPLTDIKQLNLFENINDVITRQRYFIQEKDLTVYNQVDAELTLVMNSRHLEAIIRNILENAVKYSEYGGEVIVTGESGKGGTTLSIADTGIGMNPDELTRIFDEFYRADPSRHERDSHGLGLSIVRKIVDLYQGTVRAESQGKGKGSTFRVWVPKEPTIEHS
ncbi:MAG: ATP-binding protein [Methanobacteriota archaeon]